MGECLHFNQNPCSMVRGLALALLGLTSDINICICFACGRSSIMLCVYRNLRHRWFWGLTRIFFLGGSAPPQTPKWSAAVAASKGQEGPTVIALVGRCRGLRRPVFGVMSKISQDQHV